ncbi:MAG: YvcK family protein [Candidatus Pacearchaeota archaeon]
MKKIVTVGGGTGQYMVLKGLKNYDVDLTAVVNVCDDGGSSGKLRVDFGVLPPGDIRNCLVALSDDSCTKELIELFSYRFDSGKKGKMNHNLGNLILTALMKKYGNIAEATKIAAKILNIKGKVYPVTIDNTTLFAKTNENRVIRGENKITSSLKKEERIINLWISPKAFIYREAAEEIREADLIVISAGDLYGSVIPNFLVEGFKEAIKKRKGKIVYVCNLVTKRGTYGFKASDFVREIEKYLEERLDYIICNTKKPTRKVVDKYSEEESFFVEIDINEKRVIKKDLLIEFIIDNKITARHDSEKLAKILVELV